MTVRKRSRSSSFRADEMGRWFAYLSDGDAAFVLLFNEQDGQDGQAGRQDRTRSEDKGQSASQPASHVGRMDEVVHCGEGSRQRERGRGRMDAKQRYRVSHNMFGVYHTKFCFCTANFFLCALTLLAVLGTYVAVALAQLKCVMEKKKKDSLNYFKDKERN